MEEPKYGATNKSIAELEQQFNHSDDKYIGFEVDSFNWDDEEADKGNEKINLGQYEEDKDEYEDDFEDEPVKQNDHSAKKSPKSNLEYQQKPKDFAHVEKQIMEDLKRSQTQQNKMDQKQKQVKEIAELIEMATKSIVSDTFIL